MIDWNIILLTIGILSWVESYRSQKLILGKKCIAFQFSRTIFDHIPPIGILHYVYFLRKYAIVRIDAISLIRQGVRKSQAVMDFAERHPGVIEFKTMLDYISGLSLQYKYHETEKEGNGPQRFIILHGVNRKTLPKQKPEYMHVIDYL